MTDDLNLPFEAGDRFELDLSDADLCGGVVMLAATAPLADGRIVPVVVFRFTRADGSGFLRPIIFGGDKVDDLRRLVPLVSAAVATAIEAAS